MKSRIVELPTLTLVGFNFFGDPFRSHAGWTEENEIGRLWKRWMAFMMEHGDQLVGVQNPDVAYEVHIYSPEMMQTGEFEIFTGIEVAALSQLPPQVVVKQLPAGRYAVFTLTGSEINADWQWDLDAKWLPELGVKRDMRFSFQRYDARFKGVERIDESELDIYIPLLA